MLTKFIKNLRAKPEHIRKGITLAVSLGVTSVVAFFWFISFLNYSSQALLAKPKVESPTSFLGKMSSLIGESYANVRSKIASPDSVFIKGGASNATTSTMTTTVDATEADTVDMNIGTTSVAVNGSDIQINETPDTSTRNSVNLGVSSKSLSDILNTKKQDNQGAKATTSNEVLVQ